MTGFATDVVVRCKNEMPFTRRTLEALRQQLPVVGRVVFIDSGSTDGSRECAVEHGVHVVDIEPSSYVPGRVINMGMRETSSPVVAFVNADAIPLSPDAVLGLVQPFREGERLAATFGRQVARSGAERLTAVDMGRAFGDRPVSTARGFFFSMAASAISRRVWETVPFDEELLYSEDVDWTQRVASLGWRVQYVPQARFEHSHDYDPAATHKRRHGEGVADTKIFRLGKPSVLRDFARPLLGSLARDALAGLLTPRNARTRWQQASGYYAGRATSTAKSVRSGDAA